MSRIFISYRRSDSAQMACQIYECLRRVFGRDSVFRDAESIGPGRDFRGAIREAVVNSDAVLVLIGPGWAGAGFMERNALASPDDYVRAEVEMALQSDRARVIPVCIRGARMPLPDSLPPVLRPLAYKQAFFIRRFRRDMSRLIDALSHMGTTQDGTTHLDRPEGAPTPGTMWPRRRVAVTIGRYDGDLNRLLRLITELTDVGVDDIRIDDVRLGSIAIVLLMPWRAATRLTRAFRQKPEGFEALGVVRIAPSSYLNRLLSRSAPFLLHGVDWRGENLSGIDLRKVDLRGSNLSGARLDNATLIGANLNGSNLSQASLLAAQLEDAQLAGANLRSARLVRAHMRKTCLKCADLTEADLEGAFLFEAILAHASLRRATLKNANLGAADIQGADMRGSNLDQADMRWTALELATFDGDTVLFDGTRYRSDIEWDTYKARMAERMLRKQFVQSV